MLMESKGSRTERITLKLFAVLFGAALLIAPAVSAQYGAPPKQQPAAPPEETVAPATPPVNKAEEDAARAFFALKMTDATQAIQAGEDFLQKYADSRYRDSIYAKFVHDYLNAGKEDLVVKTGDKALLLNPDNVDVLAFMSWYLGHRHHPNALDAEQRLQSVERYGRHALELIATMQKPEGVLDADFARAKNEKEGLCHSGLGLFYFWANKLPEMAAELTQATTLDPTPDPTDFYLLGGGDAKRKKYSDAASAYERCSLTAWVWQDRCKTKLAQAKALAAGRPGPATAPPATPPAAPAAPHPAAGP